MKKMIKIVVFAIMCMSLGNGCMTSTITDKRTFDDKGQMTSQTIVSEKASPLKEKSMTVDASGYGLKLTTAVDPASGTALPSLDVLVGRTHLGSSPMPENSQNVAYEYLSMDRSMWNNNMTGLVYERKASGTGANAPASVKIMIETDAKKDISTQPSATPVIPQIPTVNNVIK